MKNNFIVKILKNEEKLSVNVSYVVKDENNEVKEDLPLPEYLEYIIHSAIQNDGCMSGNESFESEESEEDSEVVEYFVEWKAEI